MQQPKQKPKKASKQQKKSQSSFFSIAKLEMTMTKMIKMKTTIKLYIIYSDVKSVAKANCCLKI